ncbi:transposase [Nodosilinea sp. LEGE 07088]|uniref:IS66 family transposase n=1 Tax=Nodosilinea sp. LEGE 07088 TaxID=2777968 RepID=UPI0018826864|nr:transposase [Nodosilinea sp. LEGE 07088]MBE9141556.1 transposase [Nodosilinea sp. LEGE 07088]
MVRQQQQQIQSQQEMIERLESQVAQQGERIKQLEEELRAQKKLKGKPKLKASHLNDTPADEETGGETGKRGQRGKRSKKAGFAVDRVEIIQPSEIPAGARFNGYRTYDVQELELSRQNIRFQLAEYVTVSGETVVGQLPDAYRGGHYGPTLVSYILYQHYQCRVPQPLIYEQLQDLGIGISAGQINRILTEGKSSFHQEQQSVLRVGLETATYIHTDDTGARHQGKTGYCTVIGNAWFAYFSSGESKSRRNFLEVLQGRSPRYILNDDAQGYLATQGLAAKHWATLRFSDQVLATEAAAWQAYLSGLGIVSANAVRVITEAALLGGVLAQGIRDDLRILSDGAGQFKLLHHGLCWVHAERALRRLAGSTAQHRLNIAEMQDVLWTYYRQLQAYRQAPTAEAKQTLEEGFDQRFGRCYRHHVSLNIVLQQFRDRKAELLRVLDCPELPLHNNAAETDIREYVTRRKISGTTRSEAGRQARDTLVGLKKTCRKLGISFWQYLLSRIHSDDRIPPLPDVIRAQASAPQVAAATCG